MTIKKIMLAVLTLVSLSGCEMEITSYEDTWEHRAHKLQRDLDRNQPLVRSTFLGTHNSYNASAYTTTTSYLDPNQTHSLTSQLRMGIRALELDVHSFVSYDESLKTFVNDIKLCHGQGNHLGCSPWDRNMELGLLEITDWISLPENKDEVLIIYLEDHIDSEDYPEAIQVIEDTLGHYTYTPEFLGCNYIPEAVTKNTVTKAGKNILLISDGCNNQGFNQWVYGGFEGGPGGYPTASVSNLLDSETCIANKYSQSEVSELFVRIQEDRTTLSNLVGVAGPKVTPEIVSMMTTCEINLIGMDKLRPFDGRLTAAIWSWGAEQPSDQPNNQCASHNDSNHFEVTECETGFPFACRDNLTGEWYITSQSGSWDQGHEICDQSDMSYTVPFSGFDNQQLANWKKELEIKQVWLGYGKQAGASWEAF